MVVKRKQKTSNQFEYQNIFEGVQEGNYRRATSLARDNNSQIISSRELAEAIPQIHSEGFEGNILTSTGYLFNREKGLYLQENTAPIQNYSFEKYGSREIEIKERDLIKRLKEGDSSVRFIPNEEISRLPYDGVIKFLDFKNNKVAQTLLGEEGIENLVNIAKNQQNDRGSHDTRINFCVPYQHSRINTGLIYLRLSRPFSNPMCDQSRNHYLTVGSNCHINILKGMAFSKVI